MTLRAIVVGRGPWGNMFEFTVAFAASIIGGYLVLQRRYPIRSIGFLPIGVATFMLFYAAFLGSEIKALVPALQNAPLLTIHVGMAVISYGTFATSFGAGVAYLIQGREDRFRWLPSHKTLDEVAYRSVIFGFPIFATMIVLGSWWASIAWSRYWGWDPKETAALVTWLTYAVYLHARNEDVGRAAGGAAARRRVRDGPHHVFRLALVHRAARLQRTLTWHRGARRGRSSLGCCPRPCSSRAARCSSRAPASTATSRPRRRSCNSPPAGRRSRSTAANRSSLTSSARTRASIRVFGSQVRWSNDDGWTIGVSGAGADFGGGLPFGGSAYLTLDRITDGKHLTTYDPSRCIIDIEVADATAFRGSATCKKLEWYDALNLPFGPEEPKDSGEPEFDAEITFEAAP